MDTNEHHGCRIQNNLIIVHNEDDVREDALELGPHKEIWRGVVELQPLLDHEDPTPLHE
jgi:hypothetical protein